MTDKFKIYIPQIQIPSIKLPDFGINRIGIGNFNSIGKIGNFESIGKIGHLHNIGNIGTLGGNIGMIGNIGSDLHVFKPPFSDLDAVLEANRTAPSDYGNSFGSDGPGDESGFSEAEDGSLMFGDSIVIEDAAALTHSDGHASLVWEEKLRKAQEAHTLKVSAEVLEALRAIPCPKAEPPPLAEVLLTAFIPKKGREAILGDFDERFANDCAEFGPERARRRYWGNAIHSLLPLAIRALKHFRAIALFEVARRYLFG